MLNLKSIYLIKVNIVIFQYTIPKSFFNFIGSTHVYSVYISQADISDWPVADDELDALFSCSFQSFVGLVWAPAGTVLPVNLQNLISKPQASQRCRRARLDQLDEHSLQRERTREREMNHSIHIMMMILLIMMTHLLRMRACWPTYTQLPVPKLFYSSFKSHTQTKFAIARKLFIFNHQLWKDYQRNMSLGNVKPV